MKRRRAWKIVMVVAAAIFLAVGGLVLDAHRRAAALLDREREAVKAEVAAYLARAASRPPSLGDPIDGNAWDYYGPAVAALEAMPAELADLFPELNGEDPEGDIPPDDHALHNLVLQYRPEIDRLRKGARCRIVSLGEQMLDVLNDDSFPKLIRCGRFLSGVVAHEQRMGRSGDSLGVAGLGLQFAQDVGRSGVLVRFLVQLVIEGAVTESLKESFAGSTFSPESLDEFARVLDRLDETRPDLVDSLKGEEIYIRRALVDIEWDRLFAPMFAPPAATSKRSHVWPSWKALYSERISRAQALGWVAESFQQLEPARSRTPWERIAALERLDRQNHVLELGYSSGNPLINVLLQPFARAFRRDAVARLQRLLLRVSVAIARYESGHGRPPESLESMVPAYLREVPLCPLTGLPLRTREGRVWSVGRNRVDDGGVEDASGNDDGGDNGDVVWTVRGRK